MMQGVNLQQRRVKRSQGFVDAYRWWIFSFLLLILVFLILLLRQRLLPEYDLIISGATLFDGERFSGMPLDVGIKDGHVAKIGHLTFARARRQISARHRVLAPGFIDTHVHVESSMQIGRPLRAQNFVRMGVTTLITGNCGTSHQHMGDMLRSLGRTGSQVNLATLVGHNTIREKVMGMSQNVPTNEQLKQMRLMVEDAMHQGALGLSTGLEYAPGVFAKPSEVIELAKVAARWKGVYATHLRNEGVDLTSSLDEAVSIARQGGLPLHISHLKIACKRDWGRMPQVLARLSNARAELPRLTYDVYAYDSSASSIDLLLPAEFRGSLGRARSILDDRQRRVLLVRGMVAQLHEAGFSDYSYARVTWARDLTMAGRSIPELTLPDAERRNLAWIGEVVPDRHLIPQIEAILYLYSHGGAQLIYRVMSIDDMVTVLSDEHTCIGSDSAVRGQDSIYSHPRGLGNFETVLGQLVRDQKRLTLESALRKMTSVPALIFGLSDRGRLAEGWPADVVLFDPATIRANATYDDPLASPDGVDLVVVNGQIIYENSKVQPGFPGIVLRHVVQDPGPLPAFEELVSESDAGRPQSTVEVNKFDHSDLTSQYQREKASPQSKGHGGKHGNTNGSRYRHRTAKPLAARSHSL